MYVEQYIIKSDKNYDEVVCVPVCGSDLNRAVNNSKQVS